MVDITRDKPLQPRTYKILFVSAILLSHALFYGSVYGCGLRFRAVHGRWPRAMIDQAPVYRDSWMSGLHEVFSLTAPIAFLSVPILFFMGLLTAFPPARATTRREKLLGLFESGLAILLVLIVLGDDPVMRWMID